MLLMRAKKFDNEHELDIFLLSFSMRRKMDEEVVNIICPKEGGYCVIYKELE